MTAAEFRKFYAAVHDNRLPFPWQERLVERILAGEPWPGTIAVPTGCGKTSVIDAAVFALASQGPRADRTAPLRTFFVIDRRLVVDDVTAHALLLARRLRDAQDGIIAEVASRLRAFGARHPLAVATLRGGMYRSETWADAPNQPLVCVSTIDQIGSRLLFRGYGVSDHARPVHAAMVANDSLIIVDEAHLSQPFLDTLGWVEFYQGERWAECPQPRGISVVRMSATIPSESDRAIRLDAADIQSDALRPRLEAKKLTELKEVAAIERAAAEEAVRLALEGAKVIGVVLNTVASARNTYNLLRELGHDVTLLTGRIRPYDRDQLLNEYKERLKAGRKRAEDQRLFVVATQTIEVGADLDFDALVTEAAPLDSLRQRFGRLNRLGELRDAHAVILKPKRASARDWIYGKPLEATWAWLREKAAGGAIDFSVRSTDALLADAPLEELTAKRENGPLIFPAHLDAWVQTNPSPAVDPDVAPFLHGPDGARNTDVQIVWRADLPENDDRRAWIEAVSLAPPVSTEAMPVPLAVARRWLRGEVADTTDLERSASEPGEELGDAAGKAYLVWRGPEKSAFRGTIRPGDTIVVRSQEGGADRFGWDPAAKFTPDIGDECANQRADQGGGRYRVRFHPAVRYPDPADEAAREELLEDIRAAIEDDDDSRLRERVRAIAGKGRFRKHFQSYGTDNQWLIAVSDWGPREPDIGSVEPDETQDDDSASLSTEITLEAHATGVAKQAAAFVSACLLPKGVGEAIKFAARHHDDGKVDDRFQMMLSSRRPFGAEPLAKGEPASSPAEYRARRLRAGYTEDGRHEFASVALVEIRADWPDIGDRDLALHLIGAHHGYGRALAPFWVEEEPNLPIAAGLNGSGLTAGSVAEVAKLDSGWVDRFWRLTRRYGWWGLAYFEAILRRADCVRSREEQA